MNPRFIIMISCVFMFIASAMMVGQKEWTMLAIVLPLWLAVMGAWVYRERTR